MTTQTHIKSRAHAEQLAADIIEATKKIFKEDNDLTYTIENNGGEEGDGFTIHFPWCGVDTGWPVKLQGVLGNVEGLGYRIWTSDYQPASRWHPEETWDVTETESMQRAVIIEEVLKQYLYYRLEHMRWDAEAEEYEEDKTRYEEE